MLLKNALLKLSHGSLLSKRWLPAGRCLIMRPSFPGLLQMPMRTVVTPLPMSESMQNR